MNFYLQADLEAEKQSMSELLSKFRIKFSDVIMIADVQKMPSAESMKTFDTLIKDLKEGSPSKPRRLDDDRECKIVHKVFHYVIDH